MSTFTPRPPYSQDELDKLYPASLQLQLVQVLLRHGERSPVTTRFRNAGLAPYWPYCNAARRLSSVAMTSTDWSQWDELKWRRRMETFGKDDGPVIAAGPRGEIDGICQLGELTDKGRETTLALGQRLRHLYVDQLKFMPRLITDADMIYLRATPMPRALESVQQAFWGLYPLTARTASFPPPTIITRAPAEETLFPNESNCRRFSQLSRAFAQRTADEWNETTEMKYLTKIIGKWMPPDSPNVAVDSHPRLSGIMDTINSTLAHGEKTRLPREFYDEKARSIIDKIATREWFSGYTESEEYRQVGVGSLVGDIVGRMVGSVQGNGNDGMLEVGGDEGSLGPGRGGEEGIKFAMSGCHDTTLAAILSSLGAFEGEKWPPYTSHVALELFRRVDLAARPDGTTSDGPTPPKGLFASLIGGAKHKPGRDASDPQDITRNRVHELNPEEMKLLDGYFVRIRYNDRPMTVPGCRTPGNHLEGDDSFCTLEAFKRIADKFTPKSWNKACSSNLDKREFPREIEKAGY